VTAPLRQMKSLSDKDDNPQVTAGNIYPQMRGVTSGGVK